MAKLEEVCTAASAPMPEWDLGWASVQQAHGGIPRIIWTPIGGPASTDTVEGDGVNAPRKLWKRRVNIQARVWGEDITHCEEIGQRLAQALQLVGWGSYGIVSEEWGYGETEVTADGELLIMVIWFDLAWTRAIERAAQGPIELDVTAADPMDGDGE
jgi:hypothetical protein